MAELSTTSLYSDANLQEYYQLEDLTGKNGNTLTNNGTATFTAAKYNNGANFGASNSTKYLTVANTLGWTGGAYSIAMWTRILTEPASGTYYNFGGPQEATTDTGLNMYYTDSAGQKQLIFWRGRVGIANEGPTVNVSALGTSAFHHLAITYDGTNVRGYLDNSLIGGPTAASGNGNPASGIDASAIGASPGGYDKVSAIIDDTGFFNRVLGTADINELYSAAAPSVAGKISFMGLMGVGN